MKKIFSIIVSLVLFIVIAFCFVGCSDNDAGYSNAPKTERLVIVERQDFGELGFSVQLYDKETKVMYMFIKSGYGAGLTVMLDENGKPLLYDEANE